MLDDNNLDDVQKAIYLQSTFVELQFNKKNNVDNLT